MLFSLFRERGDICFAFTSVWLDNNGRKEVCHSKYHVHEIVCFNYTEIQHLYVTKRKLFQSYIWGKKKNMRQVGPVLQYLLIFAALVSSAVQKGSRIHVSHCCCVQGQSITCWHSFALQGFKGTGLSSLYKLWKNKGELFKNNTKFLFGEVTDGSFDRKINLVVFFTSALVQQPHCFAGLFCTVAILRMPCFAVTAQSIL